jgi:NAD(P)H-flavin reductase
VNEVGLVTTHLHMMKEGHVMGCGAHGELVPLEMRMKRGIGMCGRCNIGDKYVCKDGPVFSLAQLKQMPPEY